MRHIIATAALALAAALLHAQTAPEKRVMPVQTRRVALVVGNAAYAFGSLRNPTNDVRAMAAALRELGFAVQFAADVNLPAFDQAVSGFAKSLRPGDVALFYYSGHGIQVDGENYLVPVDFQAGQEAEVRWKALPASQVHDQIQASGAALSILILDACRDNPFRATRSGTRGLASMNSGKGSVIAFATAPGATASDNPAESNGLFTKHLLETLREPGLDIEDVFKRVRQQVAAASQGRQVPWTASSVIGTFLLRDPAEERARLERELEELNRQIADAARRKVDDERTEKERAAASLRERLKVQLPTPPKDDTGDERNRLEELRRKREQQQAQLAAMGGQAMTLEQARQEVASMEKKIEAARAEVNAARDEALRRVPLPDKGMFETTAQFQERRSKAQAAVVETEQRHADEFEAASGPLRSRIAELQSRTYPVAQAKVEFVTYDADASLLTAKIDGEQDRFTAAPEKAKSLYEQLALVRVERSWGGAPFTLIDPATGERFRSNGVPRASANPVDGRGPRTNARGGLTYVWIPPGTFTMGCSAGESQCSPSEKPAHAVTISKGFWIGQTEVTQEAYERSVGQNPSNFKGAKLPVERVSWNEAQAYCRTVGIRLPTEAEWEYAARGGSTAVAAPALDVVAWNESNSSRKTHEVAQKQSNGFGLYDMLGNVSEWVADWYDLEYYGQSPATDPRGQSKGLFRVMRGGSWNVSPGRVRASVRDWHVPEIRYMFVGFRCAAD